jgi:hypothetical protein
MVRVSAVVVTMAFLFAQSSSVVAAQGAGEIPGAYYCEGTDRDGTPYRGTVVIARHGDVYHVQWKFESRVAAVGFGIMSGDKLAVSYIGRSVGLALYEIDGMKLVGRWTEPGGGGALFLETLTRIPADELKPPEGDEKAPVAEPGITI